MKERNWRLDALRNVMSVLVVLLHVAAYGQIGEYWRFAPTFLDALGRAAVPIFYMITGALNIRKREAVGKTYLRILKRFVVPLLLISVIAAVYRNAFEQVPVWDTLSNVLRTPAYYHLPFVYSMIGASLVLPILQAAWPAMRLCEKYVPAILVLLISRLFALDVVHMGFRSFAYPIGYMMLGAALQETVETKAFFQKQTWTKSIAFFFVYLLGATAVAWLTWHNAVAAQMPNDAYSDYDCVPTIIAAVAMYLCVMALPPRGSTGFRAAMRQWNEWAFWIYLLHPLLIDCLQKDRLAVWGISFGFHWNEWEVASASIIVMTLGVYAVTALCVALAMWGKQGLRILWRHNVSDRLERDHKKG